MNSTYRIGGLAVALGVALMLLSRCDVARDHLTIRLENETLQDLLYHTYGSEPTIRIMRCSTMTLERLSSTDIKRQDTLTLFIFSQLEPNEEFGWILYSPNRSADLSQGAATTITLTQDRHHPRDMGISADEAYISWCEWYWYKQ